MVVIIEVKNEFAILPDIIARLNNTTLSSLDDTPRDQAIPDSIKRMHVTHLFILTG